MSYKERFNNGRDAYRWWLCTDYTDSKINVNRYTLSSKSGEKFKEPRTMEEIFVFLGGKPLVNPSKDFEKGKSTKATTTVGDNINIIITSLVDNKLKSNIQYFVKSKYGLKPHSTNEHGHEILQIKKGDKLEIIVDNNVLSSFTSVTDKEEFKINFPIIKLSNNQANAQETNGNKEQKLNFNGWRNPLNGICQIRRFGYSSLPLSANAKNYNSKNLSEATNIASRFTVNNYRNKGKHQGIDLEADLGTKIYPVCVGTIAIVLNNYPGYGKTIILECNVDDLPAEKRKLLKSQNNEVIFFVYAHLSNISVKQGKQITDLNTILGETGNSGNAGSMTTIEQGSHLHFEVRTEIKKSMGQSGMNYRLDPFPWIDNCKTIENGVNLKR